MVLGILGNWVCWDFLPGIPGHIHTVPSTVVSRVVEQNVSGGPIWNSGLEFIQDQCQVMLWMCD